MSARARRRGGFSYVEVLVATTLLALVLVPALEALEIGVRGAAVHENHAVLHYHAVAKLEEVLAQPFVDLALEEQAAGGGASAYSDAPGSPNRRLVFLLGYDGNGDSVPDPGLLLVRVEIESTAHVLRTLTSL